MGTLLFGLKLKVRAKNEVEFRGALGDWLIGDAMSQLGQVLRIWCWS
jgi:hypothetical protein